MEHGHRFEWGWMPALSAPSLTCVAALALAGPGCTADVPERSVVLPFDEGPTTTALPAEPEPSQAEPGEPAMDAAESPADSNEGAPDLGGLVPGDEAQSDPATEPEPEPATEPEPEPEPVEPDPVATDPTCDVGVPFADRQPQALSLSGSLGAHDPVIIAAHDRYYYFSTGNGIATKVSDDLLDWDGQPSVFPDTPEWFQQRVPEYSPRNIWAPDIAYFGGQFHLYYSVSSFGDNRSCIGHATRAALDEGQWTDHEAVVCSNQPGNDENWNAIDPNVVLDEQGTPWMSFGSFWSGIKMVELGLDGSRANDALYDLASRGGGSIEAPFIVRRCGFYYLFISFGSCCQGVNSSYNINVGRSEDVLGPYVDRDGRPLMDGGGTRLVEGNDDWAGPGHNAIFIDGTRAYNVYHAYSRSQNGASRLRISELVWDDEGWPISGGP